jgi:hypothetical protein
LAAQAALWSLGKVWPGETEKTAWVALLMIVYPAFRQQYASVIYSHYYLQFAIQAVSIGLGCLAVARPRLGWAGLLAALGLAAVGLFTSEYFFGLEASRPVFLWLALANQAMLPKETRLRRWLAGYAPFFALIAAFLVWRVFIFQFPTYQPFYTQYPGQSPLALGLTLGQMVLTDMLSSGLYAWIYPLQSLAGLAYRTPSALAALGLTIASFLFLFIALKRAGAGETGTGRPFGPQAMLAGAGLLLASGLPFWFVNLRLNPELLDGSRLAIAMMLGASLLAVGLIAALARRRTTGLLLVAGLAGLGIGQHFLDGLYFREVHKTQAVFFQQLLWRAPGLQPGTLILVNEFQDPILQGDNSLTAALNWLYDRSPNQLRYVLLYLPERLDSGSLPGLDPGLEFKKPFRTTDFYGNTSAALVVYFPYPDCLRVLDPQVEASLPKPREMPRALWEAVPLSNLEQIIPGGEVPAGLPPAQFKYQPPASGWCYYYQQADLARQNKDWAQIVRLGEQAQAQTELPQNTRELIPFIEGYLRAGELARAEALILRIQQNKPEGRATTQALLCATLRRVSASPGVAPGLVSFGSQIIGKLECP